MKQEYQGYTGVWRRLKSGAAIFIRDGEDIRKAVRRNFTDSKNQERLKEIREEDDRAFDREQQARKERMRAYIEKGELSDEYNKADMDVRSAKDEQDRLRNERYRVEDEAQKTRFKNEFGIKVNPAQVEQLKKIGQVSKNTADLENSIIAHKETRAKMNKVGMQNASYELTNKDLADEIAMNEFKNKYARFYGHEAMKEVEARTIADLDKKATGEAQTKDFHSMTRKQLAEYIVNDQIKRGVVKAENKEMQIEGRLKGVGAAKAMSKQDLIKGAEDTAKRSEQNQVTYKGKKYNITEVRNEGYFEGQNADEENPGTFAEHTPKRYRIENPNDKSDWGWVTDEELKTSKENVDKSTKNAHIPYKYGSHTPGEFTEAEYFDEDKGTITYLIPAKLEVTEAQLQKWNGTTNYKKGDIVKAPYDNNMNYTDSKMQDFKVLETGKYPILEGKSKVVITKDQVKRFEKEYRATLSRTPKQKAAEIDKANKKDLTYEEFLKKHFGHEIDRMDLSEEDDDALYQEWLKSKKKK